MVSKICNLSNLQIKINSTIISVFHRYYRMCNVYCLAAFSHIQPFHQTLPIPEILSSIDVKSLKVVPQILHLQLCC